MYLMKLFSIHAEKKKMKKKRQVNTSDESKLSANIHHRLFSIFAFWPK